MQLPGHLSRDLTGIDSTMLFIELLYCLLIPHIAYRSRLVHTDCPNFIAISLFSRIISQET